MKFTPREGDRDNLNAQVYRTLEPVARGLGLTLVELVVNLRKGKGAGIGPAQIRVVVYPGARGAPGVIGVDDCSRAHRAFLPRLELTFPGRELYLEVSSPGIDRLIKDGGEFACFLGRGVRCYLPAASGWTGGALAAADDRGITLETEDGERVLAYDEIAKAKLDAAYDPAVPGETGAGRGLSDVKEQGGG